MVYHGLILASYGTCVFIRYLCLLILYEYRIPQVSPGALNPAINPLQYCRLVPYRYEYSYQGSSYYTTVQYYGSSSLRTNTLV